MGWGKSTQLGYGLGITMGAKLAAPDKLCINVMGDCRHRHDRHGYRDRGAQRHRHSHRRVQQPGDGVRART